MREILFRGRRITNGEWIYGDYFRSKIYNTELGVRVAHSITYYHNNEEHTYCVDPSTVGQYTGKTDKDKAKIFENDIIRANHDSSVGVIRFGEAVDVYPGNACHVGFYVDWQGEDKDYLRADLGYWARRGDVEVVGNIHDNPELLEEQS